MRSTQRLALALALPVTMTLAACGGGAGTADDTAADTTEQMVEEMGPEMTGTETVMVAEVGLQTPESVLYDPAADVYLVSNINGAPTADDDNGFISQVAPNGEVAALKWIDGQTDTVTLSAPKGLALKGDTLFVTDITYVRAYDRVSGEPLGSWEVPGSTFLNDLAVGPDGTLYVSDSGLNPDFSSSGTDAIYRFENGEPVVVAEGAELGSPNGLAVKDGDIITVGFGGTAVQAIPTGGGAARTITELPGGQLDGVVVLDDGSMLVSSWETATVYHVPADGGEAAAMIEGVPSPADIGWDAERGRVLIPVFNENRLELRHLEPGMPETGAAETGGSETDMSESDM